MDAGSPQSRTSILVLGLSEAALGLGCLSLVLRRYGVQRTTESESECDFPFFPSEKCLGLCLWMMLGGALTGWIVVSSRDKQIQSSAEMDLAVLHGLLPRKSRIQRQMWKCLWPVDLFLLIPSVVAAANVMLWENRPDFQVGKYLLGTLYAAPILFAVSSAASHALIVLYLNRAQGIQVVVVNLLMISGVLACATPTIYYSGIKNRGRVNFSHHFGKDLRHEETHISCFEALRSVLRARRALRIRSS